MTDEYISTRLSEIEKERLDLINKAAERLESWTDSKQLKVKIETPEQIAQCFIS